MAGSSLTGGMESAEFERNRDRYVGRIREGLQEAAALLSQLNKNLAAWGERAGQTQALSQVWIRFEEQLAVLGRAVPVRE
ncbi:hypothetical protein XENTR_v10010456 [Xenopus tropicalis]|nr:hypothetical protein XENTR_v10010456 [Xenopus tropicalis]